jgi:TolA-binding protein
MPRRIGLVFALCLAALPLARSPARAEEEPDREALLLFNTASHFYRQKNWKDAASSFSDFLKRFPQHKDAGEARFAAGYCLNRLGDHAAAVEMLRVASREVEATWAADACFYLGRSLEALGLDPKASSEDRRRRLEEAAESYGRAAGLHEKHGKNAEAEAKPDGRQGESPEERDRRVAEATRRLEEHRDLTVLARGAQGEALYQAGSYAQSAKALETLLTGRESHTGSAHYHRAIYVLGLARHALAGAEAAQPGMPRYLAAREALRVAADPRYEKEPLWEEAAYLLARLAHEDGDLPEAIERYGRVKEKRLGRAPEASYYRALALYESRKPEALGQVREELSRFSRDYAGHALVSRARFYEGACAFESKDYRAAEALFGKAAQESRELAGRALLRQGQALLLVSPSDPGRATEVLEAAVGKIQEEASAPGADPPSPERAALLAEAMYWLGEAHLARGAPALEDAVQSFREVRTRFAETARELSEKALYQEARALHQAGKLREGHEAAELYRKLYTQEEGAFYSETLLLSAECAFHAERGQVPDAVRAEAPRLYREARAGLKDSGEGRRAHYMEGLAHYFLGEYREAAAVLEAFAEELGGEEGAAKEFPELTFYLADSLAQEPRPASPSVADRERWKRAAGLFREYLDRSRDGKQLPNALVNLGLCQEWIADHGGAKETFQRFLASFASSELAPQVQFELGNVLVELGDREGAKAAYAAAAERLIAGSTDEARSLLAARALCQKAFLERQTAQPAKAAATLQLLLDRHGEKLRGVAEGKSILCDGEYARALALLEDGKRKEGEAALRRHIEAYLGGRHEAEARAQLARSLLDSGDASQALDALKPLLEADASRPGRDQALYLAAWCYSALESREASGDGAGPSSAPGVNAAQPSSRLREEMEAAYRKLLSEHPSSPLLTDAALELGQQLFNRKAYPEAKKWLEQVREHLEAEVGPVEPEKAKRTTDMLDRALAGLGFIAFEGKEYREAASFLDRVASRKESALAPRAAFQAGKALLEQGEVAEAAKRFRMLDEELKASAGPLREESLLRLAECQHQLREYAEAASTAERLLAEYPAGATRHEARFVRGFAEQFLGDFEKAASTFREVVAGTGAPVAARAQYHLAECLVEQAKFRDAAREFNVVVANFDIGEEYEPWIRRALLAAGMAYQSAGDLEAASTQYRELVAKYPGTDEGKAAAERLQTIAPEKT